MSALMIFTFAACAPKTPVDDGQYDAVITVGDYVSKATGVDAWILQRQAAFDEAYPNIKVQHVANPNTDVDKQVQSSITAFQSGTAYTVLFLSANVYARTLWNTGLIEDWAPYMENWEHFGDLNENILTGFYRKEKLVAFPKTQEMVCLGFNRGVLKAMGVEESEIVDESGNSKIKTWKQFYDLAKRLTSRSPVQVNGNIVSEVSGFSAVFSDFYLGLGAWLIANGFDIATQGADRTINLDFDSPKVMETFDYFMDMYADGILPSILPKDTDALFSTILDGKVGSFIFYPAWSSFFTPLGMYNEDILMIPIPRGPSASEETKTTPNFAQCYVLSKKATEAEKQAAATYIQFMTSPEAWQEQISFISENEIGVFSMPPYDNVNTDEIVEALPIDWQTTILTAEDDLWLSTLDSDNWKEYLARYIPEMIKDHASLSGHNVEALKNDLNSYQSSAYSEWLTQYNSDVLNGRYD